MSKEPTATRYAREAFVESIACVTDFTPASMNAFAHALMMALNLRCDLTLLHVEGPQDAGLEWSRVPLVRGVLQRWGYLEPGSPRSAVFEKTAVRVRKVEVSGESVQEALRDLLREDPVDLVVFGTDGRRDIGSWLRPSVPDHLLQEGRTMALFVPEKAPGFVSLDHGGFTLRRVLIPVDSQPDPRPAVTYAFRAAVFSSEELVRMYLLHVGSAETAPQIDIPIRPYLAWEMLNRTGAVTDQILQAAQTMEADLLVMPTHGSNGFLGARRSGIAQEVVRSAPCPVLTVPVGG